MDKTFWITENSQSLQTALIQTLLPSPLVSHRALFSHPSCFKLTLMTSLSRSDQRVRLFVDDTALYLCIRNLSEANTLQEDLCKLELWEKAWDMSFNPTKCQVLHVTRLKSLIPSKYFFHSIELESVSAAKYLGVTVSDDLSWGTHIANITKKANQT